MLIIWIPTDDQRKLKQDGVDVNINGHPTRIKQVGKHLHYTDHNNKNNRCAIADIQPQGNLLLFCCASDGQELELEV